MHTVITFIHNLQLDVIVFMLLIGYSLWSALEILSLVKEHIIFRRVEFFSISKSQLLPSSSSSDHELGTTFFLVIICE